MGTVTFEFETSNLDESTNRTIEVCIAYMPHTSEDFTVRDVELTDEEGNTLRMDDLSITDQDLLDEKTEDACYEDCSQSYYELQSSIAENYYEGDR